MNESNDSIILIFGGSGFIGKSITNHLNIKYNNKKIIFPSSDECNLEDKNSISNFVKSLNNKNLQVVFSAGIVRKQKDSFETMHKNIAMVENLLNCLSKYTIISLIFMSSIDVYENINHKKITEENLLLPKNYYGFSKMYNESTIKEKLKNTNISILRLPGVYGNGKNSLIDTFINRIFYNKTILLENEGKNLRDYLFVEDLCRIVSSLLIKPSNAIFNISSGNSTSVLKIVKIIEKLLNKKANLEKKVNQYTNINIMISNKKILDHLSNFKFTTIEEGIQTIVNQILE